MKNKVTIYVQGVEVPMTVKVLMRIRACALNARNARFSETFTHKGIEFSFKKCDMHVNFVDGMGRLVDVKVDCYVLLKMFGINSGGYETFF